MPIRIVLIYLFIFKVLQQKIAKKNIEMCNPTKNFEITTSM
jgi:hypothetical protein